VASSRTIIGALAFLGFLAPASVSYAQECAAFDTSSRTGKIANDAVDEASGLAASWRHEDLLWTHNDSGDEARLFLMKHDGTHVATVTLEGVDKATDWEDMAVGPCAPPSEDEGKEESAGSTKSCVYIADIGDNRSKRKEVVIHRFEEPALPDTLPADISVKAKEHLWFTYPGGARDAETVMVHPKTGAIYVVDKRVQGDSGVFRIPRGSDDKKGSKKQPILAVEVGQLRLEAQTGFGSMITAGDISPDGSEFTVRTYLAAYTFCADGDDFETAVAADPVPGNPPFMIQSEALGYDRTGKSIWVTSERRPSPLYRMERSESSEASESPEK
jgi:hypothetical protein